MEKKMETTLVRVILGICRGRIRVMEKKVDTTIVYLGYIRGTLRLYCSEGRAYSNPLVVKGIMPVLRGIWKADALVCSIKLFSE